MSTILAQHAHRPWPLPSNRWGMAMRWHDLLFAHWPIAADKLQPLIPPALEIDTWDGWAWIGIVPFRMTGVRLRGQPSRCALVFPELNVRTYVRCGEKSGVWFFSLDATSRLAVRAARAWYRLPYFDATIDVRHLADGAVDYRSCRTHRGSASAALDIAYRPTSEVFQATRGSLEHWLIERYCLFADRRRGRAGYADVHHAPWPLQTAEAEIRHSTMIEALGLQAPPEKPLLHFARELRRGSVIGCCPTAQPSAVTVVSQIALFESKPGAVQRLAERQRRSHRST